MSQYVPVYLRTYEKTFSGFFKTPRDKWDKWDSTGTTALFRYRRANAPHVEMRCQDGRGLEPEVPGPRRAPWIVCRASQDHDWHTGDPISRAEDVVEI